MLESVRKWVLDQGYPLEMRTTKAFREAGFEVHQSEIYYDDFSQSSREIDLLVLPKALSGLTKIVFLVECKSSKKPWIIFSNNQNKAGMNIFFSYAVMSTSAIEALDEVIRNDQSNSIDPVDFGLFDRLKWFRKIGHFGYLMRQSFSDVDSAYAALCSVMKAACHTLQLSKDTIPNQLVIAFPILVIDSPLILCYLDDQNEVKLEEIASGEVIFTSSEQERRSTCIRVVTSAHLPVFIAEAKTELEQLELELEPRKRAMWREMFASDYPF